MSNKKGFTLIELLAVIVILGVIMVIAVPAITNYINNSRKDSYISTAKQYIDALKKDILNEEFDMPVEHNDSTYINLSSIELKNDKHISPYNSDFKTSKSYVRIENIGTSDEPNYKYYFSAEDEKGNCINNIEENNLKREDVTSSCTIDSKINLNVGDLVSLNNGDVFRVYKPTTVTDTDIELISEYGINTTYEQDSHNPEIAFNTTRNSTYTGSKAEVIVNNYVNRLKSKLTGNITGTLPSLEDVCNIIKVTTPEPVPGVTEQSMYNNIQTSNNWILNISYWLITPYNNEINWIIDGKTKSIHNSWADNGVKIYIKPVITISKENIK